MISLQSLPKSKSKFRKQVSEVIFDVFHFGKEKRQFQIRQNCVCLKVIVGARVKVYENAQEAGIEPTSSIISRHYRINSMM